MAYIAMKTAVVRPLYKGGATNDFKNYRPISILSCLAQVLEKHILRTMTSFVERFGLLSDNQYGFIAERGTQALLEDFSDCLHTGFDKSLFTCAVFLDVSKAFDSINHDTLCTKPYKLGFRGPFLFTLKKLSFRTIPCSSI